MKTIRIKVKHVLLLGILAIVLFAFGDTLLWKGIGLYNAAAPEDYQLDLSQMEAGTVAGENHRLTLLLSDLNYSLYDLVTVSDDGASSGCAHIRRESAEKVYAQYLEFAKDQKLEADHPEYVLNVALVQWFSGDVENTEEILDSIDLEMLKDLPRDHYHLIRAGMALTFNDIESTLEALSQIEDQRYAPVDSAIRKFISEYLDESVPSEKYEQGYLFDKEDRYIRYFSELAGFVNAAHYRESHPRDLSESDSSAEGVVTMNGKPLKGVFIYEDSSGGMSSGEGFDTRVFVTDAEGQYKISNVSAFAESLGIMMPWQLLNNQQFPHDWAVDHSQSVNTIHFEFNDGVKFTSLEINGDTLYYTFEDPLSSQDRTYRMKVRFVDPGYDINGTHLDVEIPAEEPVGELDLADIRRNVASAYMNSSGEVTFERLMEPLYLSGDYYFEILPVDGILSEQHVYNGLFTDALCYQLWVEGADKSEGDQLIELGKIEAAIDWFEENPSMHSLKVLIALYSRGYIEIEDVKFQPWELGGVDKEKAAAYTERLIEEYGQTQRDLSRLSRLYREAGAYDQEREVLTELSELYPSKYVTYDIAKNLINRGNYEEGIKMYYQMGDVEEDADRYYNYFILGNQQEYLNESYRELLESVDLKSYEPFFSLIRKGTYQEAWGWLQDQAADDQKTFYTLIMLESMVIQNASYEDLIAEELNEAYTRGRAQYYAEKAQSMDDEALREVLIMLREDYNWFH